MPASPGRRRVAESAFVAADPAQLAEILCIEEERVVGRDNTVASAGLRLQLPQSPLRHHFVKARVKVQAISGRRPRRLPRPPPDRDIRIRRVA